jgi:transposase
LDRRRAHQHAARHALALRAGSNRSLPKSVLRTRLLFFTVGVFRGRRGDLIKILWFDGDRLCLFLKRLERGRFVWPQAENGTASLTRANRCSSKASIGALRGARLKEVILWQLGEAMKEKKISNN